MIISRASQTAQLIRAMRSIKAANRRVRMPRQIAPTRIENEYAARLSRFVVGRVMHAFAEFEREIPRLLDSAGATMRIDCDWNGMTWKQAGELRIDVGEGKRIRELIAEARERMQRTVITSDLEDLASMFASNTSAFQKQQLARQTKAALGIDPFIADKRLMPLTEAFVDANVGLIKGLTDDVASRIEKSALLAVQDGVLWTDYRDTLEQSFGFSESRAELIARDQIGKLAGQLNSTRQRELGVTHFFWRSSKDDRVRDEHAALDGERFAYDEPPDEGLPGEPILCRCTAEPDFSTILDAARD